MNFFEVKIGRTSRRGTFEAFNSFVAKTEMGYSELYSNLRDRYKGFEISLKTVETIVEFEKPTVKEEDIFSPTVERETVHYLDMDFKTITLQDSKLSALRADFEDKFRELYKIERSLVNRIVTVLIDKYRNICADIINIEKTSIYFDDFKCTLRLKGDLKTMIEEDVQSK